MRIHATSRVTVRDLEVHDTVFLSGPEVAAASGVYSLHLIDNSVTLLGEVLEARPGFQTDTIRMRVETIKHPYLLEVKRSEEFLKVSPKLIAASEIKAKDKIVMRGEAAPEELGGKPAHTELVLAKGAVATVLRSWILRDGCIRFTVLLGRKKKFKFVVGPGTVLEVFQN